MLRALAVVLSLGLAGCDTPPGTDNASAAAVLHQYLDAMGRSDWPTAHAQLSAADRADAPMPPFTTQAGPASGIAADKTLVSYHVVDLAQTTGHATARVELRLRDRGAARAGRPATTVQLQTFNLVREAERWKLQLFPGPASPGAAPTDPTVADHSAWGANAASLPQGEPLPSDGAWSLAGRVLDAHAREIGSADDMQAYADKVHLFGLRAGYYRTPLGRRLAGVEFKLRNQGERTLAKVAITVYFKDAGGTVVAEESFYPVLVSGHSFLDTLPLKPHGIWQLEHKSFFVADAVPKQWKAGAVEARITDIGFAKPAS